MAYVIIQDINTNKKYICIALRNIMNLVGQAKITV